MKEPTEEELRQFMHKVVQASKVTANFVFLSIRHDGQLDVVTPMSVDNVLEFMGEIFDKLNQNRYKIKKALEQDDESTD